MKLDKQKIIFRVDGDSTIGLGHITRCCALADMLKNDFEIYFYTRAGSPGVLKDIKNYCVDVFNLDDKIDYNEEAAKWISNLTGNEIVVLDGYNFNAFYQQQIKNKGCKLVCIDDIHAYHFVADVIINHASDINKENYSVEPYTQLYVGTDYVLLKKIFLNAALNEPVSLHLETSPVLICFGGADPNNVTKQTLEETMHLLPKKKINVVVGAAYLHTEALKKTVELNNLIQLYININAKEMIALMQQTHIAITSASTIALEYICVKGNLFLKCIADNQKEIYASLIEKKCANPFELIKEKFFSSENIYNQYSLIDGKSNQRLLKIFKNLSAINNTIQFKKAGQKDVDLLFNWINDPEVRAQSLSSNAISYPEHVNWFKKKLLDNKSYLYIAYKNNLPAGMIRFDINEDACIISYLVDKSERGKGTGTLIVQLGISQFKKDSNFKGCLKATVKNINTPSLKIFERAGFEKENIKDGLVFLKVKING